MSITVDLVTLLSLFAALNLAYVGVLTWMEGGNLTAARYFAAMGLSGAWYATALGLAFSDLGVAWPPLLQLSQLTSGWFGPFVLLFTLNYLNRPPSRRISILILLPGLAGTLSILLVLLLDPPNFDSISRGYILGTGTFDINTISEGAAWYKPLQLIHSFQLILNNLAAAVIFMMGAGRAETRSEAREFRMIGMLLIIMLVSIILTNIMPKLGYASWFPRLAPIMPLPFVLTLWQFVRKRAETAEMLMRQQDALKAYLPSEAIDELTTLEGMKPRECIAAVLFSDLRGFTRLSEGLEPSTVIAWINRYIAAMNPEILNRKGMIDKYIGDAVLAVFGASVELENPAENAVRTAIAMQSALEQLNIDHPIADEPVKMGIGIHQGPLVIGSIGTADRRTYTVFGDTVNAASRIEGQTKTLQASILISGPIYAFLSPELQAKFEDAGSTELRGKSKAIQLYRWKAEA